MKRIGLIGCGAIGSVIARAIDDKTIDAELVAVYDVVIDKCRELVGRLSRVRPKICSVFEELLNIELDIVVEAASQEAVKQYVPKLLDKGVNVVVLSVGALLDNMLRRVIEEKSREKNVYVYIPSGAIAGVDAYKALSLVGVENVVLTTRKNPRSISRESLEKLGFKGEIREETTIYEGWAEEAVRVLPANINVAATLKLSTKAPVKVRFIADPSIDRNIHEIMVESRASRIYVRVENTPHPDNPKTSYLAALSAIQLLKQLTSTGIVVGV